MTEDKQKEMWIVVAYIAVYIVLALFTAAFGTAILLKDITAMAKASTVLPVAVGIFVCYFATMIYARYILNKDKDIECSVLKGNLIILPTLFLNILNICLVEVHSRCLYTRIFCWYETVFISTLMQCVMVISLKETLGQT